jgi:hypothetical protein
VKKIPLSLNHADLISCQNATFFSAKSLKLTLMAFFRLLSFSLGKEYLRSTIFCLFGHCRHSVVFGVDLSFRSLMGCRA